MIKLGTENCPLPLGVERAICKEMKKGSNAKITCAAQYAFGEAGIPGQVRPPVAPLLDADGVAGVARLAARRGGRFTTTCPHVQVTVLPTAHQYK